jgi:hypothetical protein
MATTRQRADVRSAVPSSRLVVLGSIVALLLGAISVPATANHVSNHRYSIGFDLTVATYNGVRLTRYDNNIAAGGVCNSAYVSPVVYQTQWVILDTTASDWVEIGTMHKTSTCKYWFWGYGFDGVWNSLGTRGNRQYGQRTFVISKSSYPADAAWAMSVGSETLGDVYFGNIPGDYVSAGLETYNIIPIIAAHNYSSLQFLGASGTGLIWQNWAGMDYRQVDTRMCGRWLSGSSWRAGQNTTC